MQDSNVFQEAERHANWGAGLLRAYGHSEEAIKQFTYTYITVWIHATKHAERPRNSKGQFLKGR